MFNSIPAPGGSGSGGPAVDETARSAAAAAQTTANDATAAAEAAHDLASAPRFGLPAGTPGLKLVSMYGEGGGAEPFFEDEGELVGLNYQRGYLLTPFYLPAGSVVTKVSFNVGAAWVFDWMFEDYMEQPLGGAFRVAIYDTEDGRPTNRLWQSDEMEYVSSGLMEVELAEPLQAQGVVWVCLRRKADDEGGIVYFLEDSSVEFGGEYRYPHPINGGLNKIPTAVLCRPEWELDGGRWIGTPDVLDESDSASTSMPASLTWPFDLPEYDGEPVNYYLDPTIGPVSPLRIFLEVQP